MPDKVFDWNDEITVDDAFTVIPEGEYNFTIKKFERGNYTAKPNAKIPSCPKAILHVSVSDTSGNELGTVEENLMLHSKTEWKLSQFFRSIGQKKHGEPLIMNWNEVPGSTGRCKITIRKFQKNDGSEGESNDVTFLDPDTSFDTGTY